DRPRSLMQDRVEGVEQAMTVGELLDVAGLGWIDVELGGAVGLAARSPRRRSGWGIAGLEDRGQFDGAEVEPVAPRERRRGLVIDDIRQRRRGLAQLVAILGDRLLLHVEGDGAQGREEKDSA